MVDDAVIVRKHSDGVPKRLIIVLSAWIFVLAGAPHIVSRLRV